MMTTWTFSTSPQLLTRVVVKWLSLYVMHDGASLAGPAVAALTVRALAVAALVAGALVAGALVAGALVAGALVVEALVVEALAARAAGPASRQSDPMTTPTTANRFLIFMVVSPCVFWSVLPCGSRLAAAPRDTT